MSTLKIYQWEWKQFPWQWAVEIKPEYRARLTRELGTRFGLGWIEVSENKRSGGHASVGSFNSHIALPKPGSKCPLGLIIHELAHVYDARKNHGTGHRASFKKALIKLQIEVKGYRMLPPIFAAIRRDRAAARANIDKALAKADAKAARRIEAKKRAGAPEAVLARTQARAKRLRTRIKRLQTALRKAERQAARMERRVSELAVPDTHAAELPQK